MTASKGPEELLVREVRSEVDAASRSVAEGAPVVLDWIWEAEMRLRKKALELARCSEAGSVGVGR